MAPGRHAIACSPWAPWSSPVPVATMDRPRLLPLPSALRYRLPSVDTVDVARFGGLAGPRFPARGFHAAVDPETEYAARTLSAAAAARPQGSSKSDATTVHMSLRAKPKATGTPWSLS